MKPIKLSMMVFAVLLVTSFASVQQIGEEVTCYKAASPPTIDGKLDEWPPETSITGVLVVGAGIAGSAAAVAAGRSGAKTMVIDRFGYPGGNMGPGMVGGAPNMEIPEALFKGGRLPGITGEFIARCEGYCNAPLLAHYFRDSQVISYVWTQMMQEVGVQFMYNTYAGDPIMEGNRVTGLFVEFRSFLF